MNKLSVASFTNLGYQFHSRSFRPVDDDLGGKTVVITGATGGLGLAAARRLSDLGARVVMVGRSEDKLRTAVSSMPGESVAYRADLSSMGEVRDLARRILAEEDRIDVLVNNVGVLLPSREVTSEGLEKAFATNLAGQYLLTKLLMPRLIESAPARVINVSSGGMYSERIAPSALQFEDRKYAGAAAYARTKRGQVILAEEWAKEYADSGVVFHAMHPGWAGTAGVEQSLPTFNKVMGPFLRTADQGADTIVWLTASEDGAGRSGSFWFDRRIVPTHIMDSTRESQSDRRRFMANLDQVLAPWLQETSEPAI